jgi:multimeric flavodoxin WrbA
MSKKIVIIDGGPRKRFNLAALLQSFTEGVKSVDSSIDVEHIYLYDIDYHGCKSCLGCKLAGGKNAGNCVIKDGLSPVLDEMKKADGLAFGSPCFFSVATGQLQSALERMVYPYLSYNEMAIKNDHRVPTATFYTMNATPTEADQNHMEELMFGHIDGLIAMTWQQPERVCAYNTYQVHDYNRYDLKAFSEENKRQWRDTHFEADRQKAFAAGVNMANKIL